MLTVDSLATELGLKLAAGGDGGGRARDPLGPHQRARGPDAVALGRRAAADHRHPARERRAAARVRAGCSPSTSSPGSALGTGFNHSKVPGGAGQGGGGARLPGARGPLRDALHRDHRGRGQPPRQRAVRRALARARRQRAARAPGPGGRGPEGDRSRGRRRGRRQLGGARRARRAPRSGRPQADRRRSSRAWARRSAPAAPRRRPSCPRSPTCAGGRWRIPSRPAAASPRPGWWRSGASGELGDFERLCVQQAAVVIALALMRERIAQETERRLSGEVLAAALSGRLAADDIRDRLGALRDRRARGGARLLQRRPGRDRGRPGEPLRAPPGWGRWSAPRRPAAASSSAPSSRPATPTRSSSPPPPAGSSRAATGGGAIRAAASRARRQRPAAAQLPRGALRAGGDRVRQRRRARGRLLSRPRRLHPAALGPGHRGAAPLLRERAGADRELRRALRGRAAALAGGVHRSQRPLGEGGERLLLPPPHPALPDQAHRGADRPRPEPGQRPRRALAGACARRS